MFELLDEIGVQIPHSGVPGLSQPLLAGGGGLARDEIARPRTLGDGLRQGLQNGDYCKSEYISYLFIRGKNNCTINKFEDSPSPWGRSKSATKKRTD